MGLSECLIFRKGLNNLWLKIDFFVMNDITVRSSSKSTSESFTTTSACTNAGSLAAPRLPKAQSTLESTTKFHRRSLLGRFPTYSVHIRFLNTPHRRSAFWSRFVLSYNYILYKNWSSCGSDTINFSYV